MDDDLQRSFPELHDIQTLGRAGGQKVVYSANLNGRKVALKLLKKQGVEADQTLALGRAEREVLAADKLKRIGAHGVIPAVVDAGERIVAGEPQFFIVESFIDGETLHDYLQREKTPSTDRSLRLAGDLLAACEWFEGQGMVHRDIKPLNIMLGGDARTYVIDLGLVRHLDLDSLTADGLYRGIGGTIGYTAPEVFRNDKRDVDVRADLYSVGVILYEMLAGRHPFVTERDTPLDVLRKMEATSVPFANTTPGIDLLASEFAATLGNRFPSRRPNSAREARQWLEEIRSTADREA